MKHLFTEPDGNIIEVQPERWVWGVLYDDDTELHQFGEDGTFHQVGEIDQSRVKLFTMYRYDDMKKRIDVPFDPQTMRLVHRYKNTRPHYGVEFVRTYMFGWKIVGTDLGVYNFILPDDRLISSPSEAVDLVAFNVGL